ncbi:hypothetical protein RhiirC2_791557 [Rhizophagus irregularis]|uniref:Uncharacterized protein n=1 Tax=Rhizophagus irregularis TaxID=588596 RepID=A0A2N1MJ04_9GLOM|nr:hypothetical protein RhiirC2_791557 [Rhizophagus irregularis]
MVEVRLGAGAEGEVISTFIASSETIRERLLGALAVLVGDKGRSPDGAEVSGRGGGRISGLITEGAGGVVIVKAHNFKNQGKSCVDPHHNLHLSLRKAYIKIFQKLRITEYFQNFIILHTPIFDITSGLILIKFISLDSSR